jgi:hypothetical protein
MPSTLRIKDGGARPYLHMKPALRTLLTAAPRALFNPRRGAYVDVARSVRLSGLHRRIARAFGDGRDAYACAKAATPPPVPSCGPRTPACSGGRLHGKRVDAELALWTLNRAALRGRALDVCTVRILRALARRRWRPVAAQLPIASRRARVATAIDLLCEASDGGIVLVEVKCTMRTDHLTAPFGTLRGLPVRLTDCLAHRFFLQLLAMDAILRVEYGVAPDVAVVVQVLPEGVSVHPLPGWADARLRAAVWSGLCRVR